MEREEALAEQIKDLKAKMIIIENSLKLFKKNQAIILEDLDTLGTDYTTRKEIENRMETSYHG